jgi:hypothetical protein
MWNLQSDIKYLYEIGKSFDPLLTNISEAHKLITHVKSAEKLSKITMNIKCKGCGMDEKVFLYYWWISQVNTPSSYGILANSNPIINGSIHEGRKPFKCDIILLESNPWKCFVTFCAGMKWNALEEPPWWLWSKLDF